MNKPTAELRPHYIEPLVKPESLWVTLIIRQRGFEAFSE